MNLNFSDEQQMLRELIQKFCESDYTFEKREEIIKSGEGFNRDFWQQFSELGWLSLPFKEDSGGLGYGPVELSILFEEFGKVLVVEPYLSTVVLSGTILDNSSFDRRIELIDGIMTGEKHLSLAYIEPDQNSDHSTPQAIASHQGDDILVNGKKSLVLNGGSANHFIVVVTLDNETTLVLIDNDQAGVSLNQYPTVDGQTCAELEFENVSITNEAIIAQGDEAKRLLNEALNLATLCVSAESIGCMTACYLQTVEYTKGRQQFGQPISNFQVLQHRMVDMFIETEMCKSLLFKAMLECDSDEDTKAQSVSALKYQVGTAGKSVAQQAVQLHGGMGVSEEMLIGHYLKKLVAVDALFGNADYHLHKFSK